MRAVIQRVSMAQVVVDGMTIAGIKQGLLVLLGLQEVDTLETMDYIINKLVHLRIFEDPAGKMNLSVTDLSGEILVVPNFTLYGDCRQGRRPSYASASAPEIARVQFTQFCDKLKDVFPRVQFGQFQGDMKVTLLNDGPVTLLLDSDKQF